MQEPSEGLLEANAAQASPETGASPNEATVVAIGRPAAAEAAKPVDAKSPAGQPKKPTPNEAPAVEPQRIELIPFVAAAKSSRRGAFGRIAANRGVLAGSAAACLTLVVAVAGAAAFHQATQSQHESQNLAKTVNAFAARLDAIDATRPKEEVAEIRKAVTDARGGLASSRDVSATIAQLNVRLDRLEREQEGRLEKLGERVDHDAATRNSETQARGADLVARIEKLEKADVPGRIDKIEKADLAGRVDKIEKKAATQTAVVTPPTPPQKATTVAAAAPGVSNEVTGSIEKPHPTAPIRGWLLAEMRSGSAIVESRQGLHEVAPGDVLPGAGKVERFEKRGREWVVVTDAGVIVQASAQNYAPHVAQRPAMYNPYGYGPGGYGDYED